MKTEDFGGLRRRALDRLRTMPNGQRTRLKEPTYNEVMQGLLGNEWFRPVPTEAESKARRQKAAEDRQMRRAA